MRVYTIAAAEADLVSALDWYDQHVPGIGRRFLDEYEALLSRLAASPRQFPLVHGELRRARFRNFPYRLFFRVKLGEVEIVACFHASREPRKWQERG